MSTIARNNAEYVQVRLQMGGRIGKREALRLCADVIALANDLERRNREPDYQRLYSDLVSEWNALVEGLHTLGIDVSQPADAAPGWHWRYADQQGVAPTMAAAHIAGISALLVTEMRAAVVVRQQAAAAEGRGL